MSNQKTIDPDEVYCIFPSEDEIASIFESLRGSQYYRFIGRGQALIPMSYFDETLELVFYDYAGKEITLDMIPKEFCMHGIIAYCLKAGILIEDIESNLSENRIQIIVATILHILDQFVS